MESPVEQLRSALGRPSGPFRVLEGVEADAAFARARSANRALLARYEELIGFELVEVHPVLLGGDPETIENKRAVDDETHRELVAFWAQHAPSANAFGLAPCEPSPDYGVLGSPDETVVLPAGRIRLKLWPAQQAAARDPLGPPRSMSSAATEAAPRMRGAIAMPVRVCTSCRSSRCSANRRASFHPRCRACSTSWRASMWRDARLTHRTSAAGEIALPLPSRRSRSG